MHRTANYTTAERSALTLAVITFLLMFVGLPRLRAADDRAKCQQHIEKAEARLDDAIRAHGPRSPEADARRQDLRKEREWCYDHYHQWWDGKAQRWHTDRDWDKDDHDHDHP